MDVFKAFDFIRNGGGVARFHTHRTLQRETVAEHSWGVATLVMQLTNKTCSAELLMAALVHDVSEHIVGDMPAPTKRSLGEIIGECEDELLGDHGLRFNLSKEEAAVLKMADVLDGLAYCLKERSMGNQILQDVYATYKDYYYSLLPTLNHTPRMVASGLGGYIIGKWSKANGS